ncbi:MAG TPA: hypothetical protein PLO14_12200 [Accumulibacter sp.]|nr:hypothetical protein [Accumulibacter sp.]MCM8597671.1 hypothetical protein [Accumulibacter sp.]MCM8661840.1 hypothetical protein [Accumulibacter sp.]HNC52981.1 hypothetical protein [Accumulibacter sp.]
MTNPLVVAAAQGSFSVLPFFGLLLTGVHALDRPLSSAFSDIASRA